MATFYANAKEDAVWFGGPYDSRENAIMLCAVDLGLRPGDTFVTGIGIPFIPKVDADDLLERLKGDADDECGEVSEEWLLRPGKANIDQLSHQLTAVLVAWLNEHGCMPTFHSIEFVEKHVVPEPKAAE